MTTSPQWSRDGRQGDLLDQRSRQGDLLDQRNRQGDLLDQRISLRLLLLLAFLAAFSPLAIDLYLASLPAIQRDLGTTPGMVQLTLTSYLVGVSIGQPMWGPISDRFGRRSTLLVSNGLAAAATLVVMVAPTIEVLIGTRFVQALAASAGMVVARAMVADLAQGYAGVRALSVMMTIHGLTPVVAPAIGGVLATFVPWRGVFAVLAAVVVAQLVATVVVVPETLPPVRRARRVDFADLGRVVRRPAYSTYALTLGLVVASVMAYIGSAAFIYQDLLGFTPLQFGIGFTVNALGMVAAGLLSGRLARRHVHPARTVGIALRAGLACTLLVVLGAVSPWPTVIVLPILLTTFCANLAMSNLMGLAMEQARGLPGAGSAMLGLFMFGISALVIPVTELVGGSTSAVPMAVVMTVATALAGFTFTLGRRWIARNPSVEAAFAV